MKSAIVCLLSLGLAIVAVPALAQAPSAQQNAPRPSEALSNKDVLAMQNAGLASDVIIAKINSSQCDFDTSPAALEQLRVAKVPNEIILAMVQAPVTNAAQATDSKAADAQNTVQHPRGYVGLSWLDAKPPSHGVLVTGVTLDSPAAHAGIQKRRYPGSRERTTSSEHR